jgi:hypothetical protein
MRYAIKTTRPRERNKTKYPEKREFQNAKYRARHLQSSNIQQFIIRKNAEIRSYVTNSSHPSGPITFRPEKRSFRLYARRQSGNRDYLDLFNIIDAAESADAAAIARAYAKKHAPASLNSAARYLVKVLTDCLIQLKTEKDPMFQEMDGYIDKILQIDKADYPAYFRCQVRKTAMVYRLVSLLSRQKFQDAIACTHTVQKHLLPAYPMMNEEKQWELYFYSSLAWFSAKDWKKAHQLTDEVMRRHEPHPQWLICKATRLLNILIHYEKGDADYIEYEIRAYQRFFGKQQLLKYFDLTAWIKARLT